LKSVSGNDYGEQSRFNAIMAVTTQGFFLSEHLPRHKNLKVDLSKIDYEYEKYLDL